MTPERSSMDTTLVDKVAGKYVLLRNSHVMIRHQSGIEHMQGNKARGLQLTWDSTCSVTTGPRILLSTRISTLLKPMPHHGDYVASP